MVLDASVGGNMMSKNLEEAVVIIDSIVASDYQSHHDRAPVQRKGIMELDTQNAILAQNKLLTQQIEALTKYLIEFSVISKEEALSAAITSCIGCQP